MAVKVMLAPAIASGAIGKDALARKRAETSTGSGRAQPPGAKRKRRRSSVYDASGNEVFITLVCLKCHKMRPLSQFGLRKMADGAIRNQPWCRTCRSGAGAEKPRRERSAEPAPSVDVPAVEPLPDAEPLAQRPSSSVAAEVAAALAGGLRR
jgi:hypothetical protein